MAQAELTKAVVVDGIAYEYMPDGTLKPLKDKTDWTRVDAMTDEEIEASAINDPDAQPLREDEWLNVKLVDPFKTPVTIRLDNEVITWFKTQGSRGYQTKINAVLRTYVEAQKKAG
jgi:uncharacterized protein (DUF4415 family)